MLEIPKENNMETAEKIISSLRSIDINMLTPLEALSLLNDFKQRI
jgi:hypothetical protein